jgi:hypothetical protein
VLVLYVSYVNGYWSCSLRPGGGRGTIPVSQLPTRPGGGRGTIPVSQPGQEVGVVLYLCPSQARRWAWYYTCVPARPVGGRVRSGRLRVRGCCRDGWTGCESEHAPSPPVTRSEQKEKIKSKSVTPVRGISQKYSNIQPWAK